MIVLKTHYRLPLSQLESLANTCATPIIFDEMTYRFSKVLPVDMRKQIIDEEITKEDIFAQYGCSFCAKSSPYEASDTYEVFLMINASRTASNLYSYYLQELWWWSLWGHGREALKKTLHMFSICKWGVMRR